MSYVSGLRRRVHTQTGGTVESMITPKWGFGFTQGKLFTLSEPKPYPKYVLTPAQKLRKIPNLCNFLCRFDGRVDS